ncbi:hypothetical protein NE236_38885 [Actinoallomurus purpureus]|uniref:hypothetical protein n=1 Tax=Actinoallomurus purpureus TaxID=478114 RepID=UPI002092DCFC|nr:hypothetical protein [Actinoallomurus purpureus]MCO6010941.1 hypothetical protein [Actinoallomurus purpureus]
MKGRFVSMTVGCLVLAACGGTSRAPVAATTRPPVADSSAPSASHPSPSSAGPTVEDSPASSPEPSDTGAGDRSSTAPFDDLPATYRVSRVAGFTQYQGNPAWIPSERSRVANAVWEFDRDGTFAFTTSNVRTDLFPLHGTYRVEGTTLSFSAHGAAANAGGSAHAELIGTMDLSADPHVVRFRLITGSGYGAVVDDQRFASATAAAYGGTVAVTAG